MKKESLEKAYLISKIIAAIALTIALYHYTTTSTSTSTSFKVMRVTGKEAFARINPETGETLILDLRYQDPSWEDLAVENQ